MQKISRTSNVEILNYFNAGLQLKNIESAMRNKLKNLLTELEGLEFVTTLVSEFQKIKSDNETKYSTFSSALKAETSINESDIDHVFESIYSSIISNKQKSMGKGSVWITDSVVDQISKNKPYIHKSYILPNKLNHPKMI